MRKISEAVCIAVLIVVFPAASWADIVILKTGEKFKTDKVYHENDHIRFDVNGAPVILEKKDIERIIKTTPDSLKSKPAKQFREDAAVSPEKQPAKQRSKLSSDIQTGRKLPAYSDYGEPGFRDIKWGLKPSQITGLENTGTDPAYGGVDEFILPGETMWFGEAKVGKIVYGFWKGRLYTITLWTAGFIEYRTLKNEVIKRYGKGMQNNKELEKMVWYDGTTDRLLEFDYETSTGLFWMRCRKLDIEVKKRYPQ